jgi:hypothetical protein
MVIPDQSTFATNGRSPANRLRTFIRLNESSSYPEFELSRYYLFRGISTEGIFQKQIRSHSTQEMIGFVTK